jgi:L-alanine-DL-glutamate epimerase-like enolase superfamily enzyme
MKIECIAADLSLRETFATSRNVVSRSRSYFFRAHGAVGEATPVRFYGDTEAGVKSAFATLAATVKEWGDPRTLWPRLNRALGYNFSTKCGIDLLLWDHLGRREGATVGALLGIECKHPVATAFSISMGSTLDMQEKLRQHPGFSVYKLKVGLESDLETVAALRAVTRAPFYVDANGGWTVDEACAKLPRLEELGVVLCEQPIFSGRRADWERVRAASGLPVIVDEYCQRPEDVALWSGWVDGVNVKLQKCGGITPAFEMIRRARDEGLRVMIGCMIESSVGIAAAAQLAPLADYVDLDSNLYLADDPYTGLACRDGCLTPSGRPGLGVREAPVH